VEKKKVMEQAFGLVTTLPKSTQHRILEIGLRESMQSYWYIIVQTTMQLKRNDCYTMMKFGVGLPYEFVIKAIISGERVIEFISPGYDYVMLICKAVKYAQDKPRHVKEIQATLERQKLIPKGG
jgi:hypothetical protein